MSPDAPPPLPPDQTLATVHLRQGYGPNAEAQIKLTSALPVELFVNQFLTLADDREFISVRGASGRFVMIAKAHVAWIEVGPLTEREHLRLRSQLALEGVARLDVPAIRRVVSRQGALRPCAGPAPPPPLEVRPRPLPAPGLRQERPNPVRAHLRARPEAAPRMSEQLPLWDEPAEQPLIGSLRWLGVEGAILEVGGYGLIVDARIRELVHKADVRGVEHFYL